MSENVLVVNRTYDLIVDLVPQMDDMALLDDSPRALRENVARVPFGLTAVRLAPTLLPGLDPRSLLSVGQ